MKLYFPVLICLLLFSSCIISINGNYYRELPKNQRNNIRQYKEAYLGYITQPGDNYLPIEITSGAIAAEINKGGYVWVYNWIPYCSAPSCKMLGYYEQLFRKISADTANKFFLVSYIYDSAMIARPVTRADFRRYIFVPKDSVYGHQAFKGHDRFTAGYTNDSIGRVRNPHLLFYKGKLTFAGSNQAMTPGKFDSLTSKPL